MRIAYQGVAGAYSHIASMTVYPGQEYLPCDTFEKAMKLVLIQDSLVKLLFDTYLYVPLQMQLGNKEYLKCKLKNQSTLK